MLRRSIAAVALLAPVVMSGCATRDSAQRPHDTLVVLAPSSSSGSAGVPAAEGPDSAAVADARVDTTRLTERFATPEAVFRYEQGGRAYELTPSGGAARIVRLEGRPIRSRDGTRGGPLYALEVSWYPLAPASNLEAWAKVHADPEIDDEAEERAAAGGPPVPAAATSRDTVAGRPALSQSLAGPEGTLERRYVVAGRWVLVFRWESDDEGGNRASGADAGVLALIDRLEWTTDRGRP